ncbi:MAG: DUF4198 domain-containing protein [Rhodospirillaceae bacterium]
MRKRLFGLTLAMVWSLSGWAHAHEYWLSPVNYAVSAGGRLAADVRVGQNFLGTAFPYIDGDYVRFDVAMGPRLIKVTGRMGDEPALDMPAPAEGLAVVVQEATPSILLYEKLEIFVGFVKHKDLKGTLEAHKARGLPEVNFRESFSRYAKSLIKVGHGQGADRAFGLLTEIVALKNPYTDDISGGLPIRVLYQGKPRADAQVEVFASDASNAVDVRTYRTDSDGRAAIPMKPGTEYLLDAVVMRTMDPKGKKDAPVWESLWASLTFKTP